MIGEIINKLRKQKGLSQSELGKKLCLSASAIGMYEQNRRLPDTDAIIKLSNFFSVSVDYLLTGEETKKAPTDGERIVSDDDIMFALWGDSDDVDEDDLDDVKRYAAFVRERKKKK